jgi:anti-anti-sigma factor
VLNVPETLKGALAGFAAKHKGCALSLTESPAPRALAITIDGSLDGETSHDFEGIALLALSLARSYGGLIFELRSLQYISSTGGGVLTSLLVETKRDNLPLYLRGIPEHAKAVFDLLGFSSFFTFLDGGEEET